MKHTHYQKILILPDAGPENPFQYQMINFLRSNGFDVSIGTKRKLGSIYYAVNQFNPEIIYFDWVHSYVIGKTFLWSFIKSLFFVFDILYLRFLRKIPIVHTLHNIQNHGGFWIPWEHFIYGFFLRRCSKIRVYSEAVKKEVIIKFRILSSAVYIIQDIPFHYYYQNNSTRKESRIHLNIAEKGFVFLFFGKVKIYKGLENLIRSFLSIAGPDDHLLIAGACAEEKYIAELKNISNNSNQIIWHIRFIPKEDVQCFFNAANVVVLPFTKIDHSGSLDLALSFSKPVITLKTEAIFDLLSHQKNLLFEKGDDLKMAMALAKEINEEEIGKNNFKIADSANYRDLTELFKKYAS
ncbi:glycosyltransferase [Dyadobacter subterraneus]|uniref:Glycosyltransferase n=1 Tax=Dyadobacter subterraneus TaxID=2773304 RepID=A0ABR9WLJ3_9BACT|nr:glycosyltransferase [Dyadobacter subterraneus]MBE9466379.1 glycosyltransferase [Dyadobacter subterraneus]